MAVFFPPNGITESFLTSLKLSANLQIGYWLFLFFLNQTTYTKSLWNKYVSLHTMCKRQADGEDTNMVNNYVKSGVLELIECMFWLELVCTK